MEHKKQSKGFINERIEEWPNWLKKEQNSSSKYSNQSISTQTNSLPNLQYQHSDTVPGGRYQGRGGHKYYAYFVDLEKNVTFFYCKYGLVFTSYIRLTKPLQQKDAHTLGDLVVHVVSNRVVPLELLLATAQ